MSLVVNPRDLVEGREYVVTYDDHLAHRVRDRRVTFLGIRPSFQPFAVHPLAPYREGHETSMLDWEDRVSAIPGTPSIRLSFAAHGFLHAEPVPTLPATNGHVAHAPAP